MIAAPDYRVAAEVSLILQGFIIKNDDDLERLAIYAEQLDEKIREGHTEYTALSEYLIEQITRYENANEDPPVSGRAVLRFLMDQHGHKLKDMIDVAPMSVISEVLNEKRDLNRGQIERLARKYQVSPAAFF